MRAAAYYAVFVNLQLIGRTKRHQFVANLDTQFRKVLPRAVRPLKNRALEQRVLLGCLHVSLYVLNITADGSVNSMLGNEDTAAQLQTFAKGPLPEPNGFRISDRRKLIVQNNFLHRANYTIKPYIVKLSTVCDLFVKILTAVLYFPLSSRKENGIMASSISDKTCNSQAVRPLS